MVHYQQLLHTAAVRLAKRLSLRYFLVFSWKRYTIHACLTLPYLALFCFGSAWFVLVLLLQDKRRLEREKTLYWGQAEELRMSAAAGGRAGPTNDADHAHLVEKAKELIQENRELRQRLQVHIYPSMFSHDHFWAPNYTLDPCTQPRLKPPIGSDITQELTQVARVTSCLHFLMNARAHNGFIVISNL